MKLHKGFSYVYYVLLLNFLWFSSVVLTLGLMIIPANISIFEAIKLLQMKNFDENQKVAKKYYKDFKKNCQLYFKVSLLFVGILFISVFSFYNLYFASGLISYVFYYVNLLLIPFLILTSVMVSYFIAKFDIGSQAEKIRSSIAFSLAYTPELLISHVLFAAVALIIFTFSPEGSLFVIGALYFMHFYLCIHLIRKGWNFRSIIHQFLERGIRY